MLPIKYSQKSLPPHVLISLSTDSRSRFPWISRCVVVLFTGSVLAATGAGKTNPPPDAVPPHSIAIGISESLYRGMPASIAQAGEPGAEALMQKSAGVPCKILPASPSQELGNRLAKDAIQLGVFSGVEFAWESARHPGLRPLAILINQHPDRRAVLLVRGQSAAAGFAGLKQGVLAVPSRSPEHCRLFVENKCRTLKTTCEKYFSSIAEPGTTEDALDDLVDGKVAAAVVDKVGLEAYQRRKPGRFGKLKALLTSGPFPDTVIAYHAGALDAATLQRLRQGLCDADETLVGRHMLTLWMATSFELPPESFDKLLLETAKRNPAPALVSQK
jgi:ABC-type phosphate/phosphonate transport system substrate-binding protein